MSLSGEFSGSSATYTNGGGSREFKVARVLASLGNNNNTTAVVAVVEEEEEEGRDGGGCQAVEGQGGNNCLPWGCKGKRSSSSGSSKRVKGSSSSLHSSHSPFPFDLNLDQATIIQEECHNGELKVEEVCESEPGLVSDPLQNGRRSRHNLTEVEKEARRIHRILANRESARQTIRRRQAFHEELTRKAAELASENESLKRSKDLAIKELQSLQSRNQKLKGQLSQTLGLKLGENKRDTESSCTDHTHNIRSASWSRLMCNKLSASPIVFPSCLSSSDVNLSQSTQHFYNSCMLPDQENAVCEKMPWLILPCPVFLPMANIKDGIHQLSPILLKDNNGEGSYCNCKNVYSPSSVIRCLHNCPLVISADKKTGALPSTQYEEMNGFDQQVPRSPCFSRGELSHEQDDCITTDPICNPDFSSATSRSGHNTSVSPENKKECAIKKSTVAGAEARRKRKELMKLKSRFHYHLLGRANG